MVRSSAAFSRTRRWLTLGCFVALGCTQQSIGTFDGQLDIRPDSTYDESWSTPLPPGVKANPDSFRSDVTPYLSFGGPTYVRLRAGNCHNCVINVSIKTLINTRHLNPDSPPPGLGRAIARIKNLDHDTTEAYYGFKPGRKADYYWWADNNPDHPGYTRITMLEVPLYGGVVRAGRQKELQVCATYYHDPATPSEGADFVEYRHPEGCRPREPFAMKKADMSLNGQLWSVLVGGVTRLLTRNYMISGGGWIDCNSGCCT
jgi:hypothetical protein